MKEIIDDNLSVDTSKLQVSLAAGKDVGQRLHCSYLLTESVLTVRWIFS